jgi:thermostable 8-oxoguanine DNA glycosylase
MPTYTVDPQRITDFSRTEGQLEALILFSIAVAGKTAKQISKALDHFLDGYKGSPFQRIRAMIEEGSLEQRIKDSKLGKHRVLNRAFADLATSGIDLRTCSAQDLEEFYGIGLKTSRFFLLHSRENAEIAALDTHILSYMRNEMNIDAPKVTPSSAKIYQHLERCFVAQARKLNMTVADLDLAVWNKYSSRSGTGEGIPA